MLRLSSATSCLVLALSLAAPKAFAADAAKVLIPATEGNMPVVSPDNPPSAAPMEGDNPNGVTLAKAINLAAQQQMPESFGALHQIVLGGSTSLQLYGVHEQLKNAKRETLDLSFSPWAGVFVARHFLVGAILPIGYLRGSDQSTLTVGVGPLLAWHVPVASHFALLPRIAATYSYGRSGVHGKDIVPTHADSHAVYVKGYLDAVVHLTHHLSVVGGPFASFSALNRTQGTKVAYNTLYGLQVGLLGWF